MHAIAPRSRRPKLPHSPAAVRAAAALLTLPLALPAALATAAPKRRAEQAGPWSWR